MIDVDGMAISGTWDHDIGGRLVGERMILVPCRTSLGKSPAPTDAGSASGRSHGLF